MEVKSDNSYCVMDSIYLNDSTYLAFNDPTFIPDLKEEAEKHFLFTFSMYSKRFMPLYRLVFVPNETNCNEKALNLAQQIPSPVNAIRNEMRQPTENSQTESSVPATESRTSINPLTIRQQTGRDKFSEIVPKAFAPP
jgi:hypothetical protein